MKMILLSSVSSPDDVLASQRAGFQRYVAKPVRRAELRQALLSLSDPVEPIPPALSDVRLQGQVLVIEDNVVNQEVMGQMLRQFGLRVTVASTALHGLRKLGEAHFDLILMDIQMPGMDGVEALSWFRRGSGSRFSFLTPPHTPVIAVTANALEGDEQRYRSLGFDDYLSKPFRQSQLLAMLTPHLSPQAPAADADAGGGARAAGVGVPSAAPATAPATAPAGPSGLLDPGALERLRELDPLGKNRLLERVSQAFHTSAARLLPMLHDALRANDLAGIRHVVHTLKSSSASIGALRLSQQCAELESQIRLERAENVPFQVQGIADEIEVVLQALKKLMDPSA
jgi:CheY-like chemotaxis protein